MVALAEVNLDRRMHDFRMHREALPHAVRADAGVVRHQTDRQRIGLLADAPNVQTSEPNTNTPDVPASASNLACARKLAIKPGINSRAGFWQGVVGGSTDG